MLIIFFILHLHSKAIHNKDYSVVKTFKAGQLAFFYYLNRTKKSTLSSGFFILKHCVLPQIKTVTRKGPLLGVEERPDLH